MTGSVAAGRSIAARAGKNLKPSSMELGGSGRVYRPRGRRSRPHHQVGCLGSNVQYGSDLLRREEIRCRRKTR
ncbi:MAG: hypothetical protein WDN29_00155 [Methylovirgula sp.]